MFQRRASFGHWIMFIVIRFDEHGQPIKIVLLAGIEIVFTAHGEPIDEFRRHIVIRFVTNWAQRKLLDQFQIRSGWSRRPPALPIDRSRAHSWSFQAFVSYSLCVSNLKTKTFCVL